MHFWHPRRKKEKSPSSPSSIQKAFLSLLSSSHLGPNLWFAPNHQSLTAGCDSSPPPPASKRLSIEICNGFNCVHNKVLLCYMYMYVCTVEVSRVVISMQRTKRGGPSQFIAVSTAFSLLRRRREGGPYIRLFIMRGGSF